MQIQKELPKGILEAPKTVDLLRVSESEAPTLSDSIGSKNAVMCPVCSEMFEKKRSNQKYCSTRCRKQRHQVEDRNQNPKNSQYSNDVRWRNRRQRQRALELAATLYGMPPAERLGFMKQLIEAARFDDSDLKSIFTDPKLLRASPNEPSLFHRKCPGSYQTISQAGNSYCKQFWNASVTEVVRGNAPEPSTGEVMP